MIVVGVIVAVVVAVIAAGLVGVLSHNPAGAHLLSEPPTATPGMLAVAEAQEQAIRAAQGEYGSGLGRR